MLNEKLEETMNDQVSEVKEEDVQLTKKDEEKVLKAIEQAHLDASKLSPETQAIFMDMLEKAKLPIRLNDKDFEMGEQELDVRGLSRSNYRQMEFRQLILQNVYLKQIVMGQTDLLRLLMVIADKLGVEDIVGATDDVIEKIEKVEAEKNKKAN